MKRECTVCMKEKWNGSMANTCESHDPLVCKLCMKEWLRQCETCPICRAVVHARAVLPEKRKRARSGSADMLVDDEEEQVEAQYAAAREETRRKEKEEQERRDEQLARELARADDMHEARIQAHVARLLNLEMFLAVALPDVFGGGIPPAPQRRRRQPVIVLDEDE
jgi:hypothetical protein